VSDEFKPRLNKKIAVFRQTKLNFECVIEIGGDDTDENWTLDEYVRLTEWQPVEFKALPPETLAAAEMDALSALRAQTVAEFTEKLSYIDGRMANLRALTGPVSP
jgi:hypothetical protein